MRDEKKHRCLSCGETDNIGNRRYCSLSCKQRLRYQLDIRSGLLKALNTRYAIFYFTEAEIILDVLAFDSEEIFSFIFSRTPGNTPADDFIRMSNQLGNAWWTEKRRTEKRYLASRHVLNFAKKKQVDRGWINPREDLIPTFIGKSLTCLKLNKSALQSPEVFGAIKSAFRKMAKQHHPDQGGDAAKFIKIHDAYQELLNWSENPKFSMRRGFHEKWFYDGYRNKWVQPIPKRDL